MYMSINNFCGRSMQASNFCRFHFVNFLVCVHAFVLQGIVWGVVGWYALEHFGRLFFGTAYLTSSYRHWQWQYFVEFLICADVLKVIPMLLTLATSM